MESMVDLFLSRVEPKGLRRGRNYVDLHTCNDPTVLRRIRDRLREESGENGEQHVLLTWVSPPYGRILGYGTYGEKEVRRIVSQYRKEDGWVSPQPGQIYDIGGLNKRLRKRSKPTAN